MPIYHVAHARSLRARARLYLCECMFWFCSLAAFMHVVGSSSIIHPFRYHEYSRIFVPHTKAMQMHTHIHTHEGAYEGISDNFQPRELHSEKRTHNSILNAIAYSIYIYWRHTGMCEMRSAHGLVRVPSVDIIDWYFIENLLENCSHQMCASIFD